MLLDDILNQLGPALLVTGVLFVLVIAVGLYVSPLAVVADNAAKALFAA